MSKEDELRDVLKETAKEIAKMHSNPRTWQSWMVFLLGQLEGQATSANPAAKQAYVEMLLALEDTIRNRRNTGGW